MADKADIRLPPELLPSDGRFGSGPSKIRNEAVAALAAAAPTYLGTSHRREGVKSVVRRIRAGASDLLQLPDGYEMLLGVGDNERLDDVGHAHLAPLGVDASLAAFGR